MFVNKPLGRSRQHVGIDWKLWLPKGRPNALVSPPPDSSLLRSLPGAVARLVDGKHAQRGQLHWHTRAVSGDIHAVRPCAFMPLYDSQSVSDAACAQQT